MALALLLVLTAAPPEWEPYPTAPSDDRGAYTWALRLLNEHRFGEATAVLNEVASRQPRWAEVFSARCSAQLGLKRPDSAAADCRYALRVKPDLVVALYGLATAERLLGQKEQAAEHFRQYAESQNPAATDELKALATKAANELMPPAAPAPKWTAPALNEPRVASAEPEKLRLPAKEKTLKACTEEAPKKCTP